MNAPEPAPRPLADLGSVLASAGPEQRGALWRLAEPGRQLDANLVRLPADAEVPAHAEPDLDVLLLAVDGTGELHGAPEGPITLTAGATVWLPHGSRRSLTAGPSGLAYLTVHRRRPGLTIKPGPAFAPASASAAAPVSVSEEGGEPACALNRVCPECGYLDDGPRSERCPRCGAETER